MAYGRTVTLAGLDLHVAAGEPWRCPCQVSAVNSMNSGFTVRAGDCLRSAKVPWAAGRSGSATVNYVLAGTLGRSRVWDGTGPGSR